MGHDLAARVRALAVVGAAVLTIGASLGIVKPPAARATSAPSVAPAPEPDEQEGDPALRDQQIAYQRGYPFDLRYNGRLRAIQQQSQRRTAAAPTAVPQWKPVGPAPIPNGQLDGPTAAVSGRVTAIAVHPTNPSIAYVGLAQGGVWRTLDRGAHWTPLFDTASSLAIGALALAPSQPTTLYVGTGEASGSGDSFAGVGLYRIDSADTTAVLNGPINPATPYGTGTVNPFTSVSISAIRVDPGDANTILVGTAYGFSGRSGSYPASAPPLGLYRSRNAAGTASSITFDHLVVTSNDTGSPSTFGGTAISDLAFEPGNHANALVATPLGVYRSLNVLTSVPAFTQTLSSSSRLALSAVKVGTVVTVVVLGGGTGTSWAKKSTNAGATWTDMTIPDVCYPQCWYDLAVAVDPTNANVIYLGGTSNYGSPNSTRSLDGGATWATIDAGLHSDVHAITIAPSDTNVVYNGNDGGVWVSANRGTAWTNANTSGLSATQFESVAVLASDPTFTIGGTQDNGTNRLQTDHTWSQVVGGDGGNAVIDQGSTLPNVVMYHGFFDANIDRSTDGGQSWSGIFGAATSDSSLFYPPLVAGPGRPNTLYLGTTRLWRTANRGDNSAVVSQDFGSHISAIGIAPTNDAVRLVGLTGGQVFLTTSGSTSLVDVSGPWPSAYVARTVIDPNNANVAYVTLDGYAGGTAASQAHVWKTTNLLSGAPQWTSSGSGIPDVPTNALVVDPANSNIVFAGTDIGVYRSDDAGVSWTQYGTGLPIVAVFDIALAVPDTAGATVRIATHGRGMWDIPVSPPTVPGAPTIGTATAGNGSATVAFAAPASDGGSAITGYTVTATPGGATASGTSSPIVVSGLTNGTAYTFTVHATNALGNGAESAASNSVTPGTTLGAPIIGTVTAQNAAATVNFSPPASDGGSAITSYTVTASPAGWKATVPASARSALVDGLTNGTAYTFTVHATNAAQTGPESAASAAATPTGPVSFSYPAAAGQPVIARFASSVHNVTTTNLVVRLAGTVKNLAPGSLKCFDASNAVANCSTGDVRRAELRPALMIGNYYTAHVNPSTAKSAIATDTGSVATTFSRLRAPLAAEETAPTTYKWHAFADGAATDGTYNDETTKGATATLTFTGTSITWYTVAGPQQGIADVYVDKVLKASVDNYASTRATNVARTISGLSSKKHTLVITVSGKKNAAAGGTGVTVDAVQVGSGAVQASPAWVYKWGTLAASIASGGKYATSAAAGSSASLAFRGTGISVTFVAGPGNGSADVYVDGTLLTTVDTSATALATRVVSLAGLGDANHTAQVVPHATGAPIGLDRWTVS